MKLIILMAASLLSFNLSANTASCDCFDLSVSAQSVNDNEFKGQSLVVSKRLDDRVSLSWDMEKSDDSITTGG